MNQKISQFNEVISVGDNAYFTIVSGTGVNKQNFIISKDNLMKFIIDNISDYKTIVERYNIYFGYSTGETINFEQINNLQYVGEKITTNVKITNVTATNDEYIYFCFDYQTEISNIIMNDNFITDNFIKLDDVEGIVVYRSVEKGGYSNNTIEFNLIEVYGGSESYVLTEESGLIINE
jgi:hypothetical protein